MCLSVELDHFLCTICTPETPEGVFLGIGMYVPVWESQRDK
jgi:hypothetical protein